MKTVERKQACELRRQGWSVKEIARHLRVSRSSVSIWVREVPLSPLQTQALIARIGTGPAVAAVRKAAAAREIRRGYQEIGRLLVRERGASYLAGCMLYWAEGSKERNTLKLVNSDPDLLACFVQFLRDHFGVSTDDVRIYCNLFADHEERRQEIEDFWLARLGLTRSSLRKSTVNTYSKASKRKRIDVLPYGTCAVVVNSTRIVQTIYGSIQEYGGFDRPAWLD